MSRAAECAHGDITCLNEHELIRKYRCADCGAVMICACDETFGRRFLAHQLGEGVELDTQERVTVTLGFQPATCNACRGLPLVPAPAAAIPGRTTKIRRFYWREHFFLVTERMADLEAANPEASAEAIVATRKEIDREVLDELKALHATAPKYDVREPSQAETLMRYQVEIRALRPQYAEAPEKGAVVVLDGAIVSPEAYVARHYEALGWSAMPLESVPLHALFGVMMWLLIEHPSDPRNRLAGFGSRTAFEAGVQGEMIQTYLPEDFGTSGYGRRRKDAIDEHFAFFFVPDGFPDRGALLDLFDYWRRPSERLRQYLWAHREDDVDRARRLIEILPPQALHAILRYLIDDYWGRYVGWPDLLLYRDAEFMLVEVKSSSDKLSADQMRWIGDNHDILKLPFSIAKLHRPSRQTKRNAVPVDDAAND